MKLYKLLEKAERGALVIGDIDSVDYQKIKDDRLALESFGGIYLTDRGRAWLMGYREALNVKRNET